jgi:uncharacterized membrane protein
MNAVRILVQHLRVKISTTSIKNKLVEHPDYPSLLSISDSLASWKIASMSFKAEREHLSNLSTPFLVQITDKNETFFSVVSAVNDKRLIISDSIYNKHYEIGWDEFMSKWTNIVTVVESSEDSHDERYLANRKTERLRNIFYYAGLILVFAITSYVSFLSIQNLGSSAWAGIGLLVSKLFGVYIGALLLWYEIDKNNLTVQKVCKAGKNKNCTAVLQSSVSKIFGIISWSEIGFIYFLGGYLFLSSELLSPSAISLSLFFGLLALPYVVFSLIYQWRVVKQWCVLCLAVQGVLFADVVIGLSSGSYTFELINGVSLLLLIKAFVFYIGLFILWFLIKPLFISSKESLKNKVDFTKLKHNVQIFQAQIEKQRKVINDNNDLGFRFGNSNASHKLIKVCNPFCGPCASTHPEIHQLLEVMPELELQIIFTATSKEDDIKSKPVKHFYAILEQYGPVVLDKAVNDWYMAKEKNYVEFSEKYPVNIPLEKYNAKLDEMIEWCTANKITYTPTLYIDGYELPDMYSVSDLKYLLN